MVPLAFLWEAEAAEEARLQSESEAEAAALAAERGEGETDGNFAVLVPAGSEEAIVPEDPDVLVLVPEGEDDEGEG